MKVRFAKDEANAGNVHQGNPQANSQKSADYAHFILFQGHEELCDWFEADSGCM